MQSTIFELVANTFTEISSGSSFKSNHKLGASIVYVIADTEPVSFDKNTPIVGTSTHGGEISIDGIYESKAWAYAIGGGATISVTELVSISGSIVINAELPNSLVRSAASDQNEIATELGRKFTVQILVPMASGETHYFGMTAAPAVSGYITKLTDRYIKAVDGEIEFAINQSVTSGITTGTALSPLVDNRFKPKSPLTTFYHMGTVAPIGGAWVEPDILIVGGNKIGGTLGAGGFRIYNQDDLAAVRIKNNETKVNRLIFSYTWIETPEY